MRKLTNEEAEKFTIKRGSSTAVRTAVVNMKPGEILLIEKKDWKQINGPGQMLTRVTKRTGMEFRCDIIVNDGGWIVKRLK